MSTYASVLSTRSDNQVDVIPIGTRSVDRTTANAARAYLMRGAESAAQNVSPESAATFQSPSSLTRLISASTSSWLKKSPKSSSSPVYSIE